MKLIANGGDMPSRIRIRRRAEGPGLAVPRPDGIAVGTYVIAVGVTRPNSALPSYIAVVTAKKWVEEPMHTSTDVVARYQYWVEFLLDGYMHPCPLYEADLVAADYRAVVCAMDRLERALDVLGEAIQATEDGKPVVATPADEGTPDAYECDRDDDCDEDCGDDFDDVVPSLRRALSGVSRD